MELKVWVEGIQRIVCGVTDKTTCQDVVYALAHATGKTGRFTLIERWRNNERLLAPQEHPLKVLQKWGEYAQDVQFILQRSALDKANSSAPLSPPAPRAKLGLGPGQGPGGPKSASAEPPAVWKPPPPAASYPGSGPVSNPGPGVPGAKNGVGARLSPDSGRGSDRTGSDSSNSYPDHHSRLASQVNGFHNNIPKSSSASQMSTNPDAAYGFAKQHSMPALRPPPAYRPPPGPSAQQSGRNSSPAEPPPYREPPPAETSVRYRGPSPQNGPVRPPHYSPPPTHRTPHLSRHPSRGSLIGAPRGAQASSNYPQHQQHGLPFRQQQSTQPYPTYQSYQPTDFSELMNLVSAQQTTLQSQHAEIKQCDVEVNFLEGQVGLPSPSSGGPGQQQRGYVPHLQQQQPQRPQDQPPQQQQPPQPPPIQPQPGSQLEMVLAEARRLEEVAHRNEDELKLLALEQRGSGGHQDQLDVEDPNIRAEIMQLKQRMLGTDQELQKTNHTLRRLGDEMRSMSLEKSRQREIELAQEIERLQMEIKTLQKNSEEAANVNQQLSKEVKEVEEQISQRKAEVEKLIQEMREVNMESLAISPPEESKQFLDGPPKPGQVRKMMGSPRQLENAVPTSKNPHGVWV